MSAPVLNNYLKKKSLVLEDGNVYKIQKVRQRRIHSCIPCHQRKIKCNRAEVCDHCLRNNLVCLRFVNDKLSNLKNSDEGEEIKKLAKGPNAPKPKNSKKSKVRKEPCKEPPKQIRTPDEVQTQTPVLTPLSISVSPGQKEQGESSVENDTMSSNSPFTETGPGISSESQVTSAEISPAEIPEDEHLKTPVSAPVITDFKARDIFDKIRPILRNFPTQDRSQQLMSIYINQIHPILPIIDINQLKVKHVTFWNFRLDVEQNAGLFFLEKLALSEGSGLENVNDFLEFIWVYSLVFYAALVAEYEQQSCPSARSLQEEQQVYLDNFRDLDSLFFKNLKKLEIVSFQVNVLVLSFGNLSSHEALLEVSKLIRLAQYYQMDHDPVIHQNLNNKTLVQLKRMIWWLIFQLDDIVSSYHSLPSTIKIYEFDTLLPLENSDQLLPSLQNGSLHPSSTFCNYAICFVNSKFRYYLLQNELNKLSNGLSASINDGDIMSLKNKINDLYIFCYSSIITLQNTESSMRMQLSETDADSSNYLNQQLKFISYAKRFLNILADKILIKFQSRILITPSAINQRQFHDKFYSDENQDNDSMNDFSETHMRLSLLKMNLNLTLSRDSTSYNYNDLSKNLLPSILHLLNEFAVCDERLTCFNWELRNYVPMEELILLCTILVVNLKSNSAERYDLELKTDLIQRCMDLLIIRWYDKSQSLNQALRVLNPLWSLIKYKFKLSKTTGKEYRIPQPSLTPSVQSVPETGTRTTISCFEIAPRTIRGNSLTQGTLAMSGIYNRPLLVHDGSSGAEADDLDSTVSISEDALVISKLEAEVQYELQNEEQEEYGESLTNKLHDLFRLVV